MSWDRLLLGWDPLCIVGETHYLCLGGARYVSWVGLVAYDIRMRIGYWLLGARVEDCMWIHYMYGRICGIPRNSLSFMLIVVD